MPGSYAFPLVDESIPGLSPLSDGQEKNILLWEDLTLLDHREDKVPVSPRCPLAWVENNVQEADRSIEDIEIISGFLRKICRIWRLGEIATRCSAANIRPSREAQTFHWWFDVSYIRLEKNVPSGT